MTLTGLALLTYADRKPKSVAAADIAVQHLADMQREVKTRATAEPDRDTGVGCGNLRPDRAGCRQRLSAACGRSAALLATGKNASGYQTDATLGTSRFPQRSITIPREANVRFAH